MRRETRRSTASTSDNVRFAYPGGATEVLRGLDLWVPEGRSLAIVGDNGSGKTTLLKLLCRFYDPTDGAVCVDGIDLRYLDPAGWQRTVAAVFQDFGRYPLPARDNVGFGSLRLRDDGARLAHAAERAGALAVVDRLPAGWDTPLSRQLTGGAELSGGQWQRIALARVLLAVEGGARVLVLDEPTASLDIRAEAEFYDRFLALTKGITTILVSHRFSTVRRADRIVVLDQGEVAEEGTHDELLAVAGGRYRAMYECQAARFQRLMRDTLRSLAFVLRTAFRADRWRAGLTFALVPLVGLAAAAFGLWLKILADAVAERDTTAGLLAAGGLAATVTLRQLLVLVVGKLRFVLQERTAVVLEVRLIELMTGLDRLEHFEHAAHLDKLDHLRAERASLGQAVGVVAASLSVLAEAVGMAVLLASVHPALLLLPLLGLPSLVATRRAAAIVDEAKEASAEQQRLSRQLLLATTSLGPAKEIPALRPRRRVPAPGPWAGRIGAGPAGPGPCAAPPSGRPAPGCCSSPGWSPRWRWSSTGRPGAWRRRATCSSPSGWRPRSVAPSPAWPTWPAPSRRSSFWSAISDGSTTTRPRRPPVTTSRHRSASSRGSPSMTSRSAIPGPMPKSWKA